MSDAAETKNFERRPLWTYELGVAILWTILIALSLTWNLKSERTSTMDAARIEARTAIEKDILYRRWNAQSDGIYTLVSAKYQPNPYLKIKNRDITTTSGLKLTMINPAYMTRQAHELALAANNVKGHLTSLKPIRPANAPDAWEKKALTAFQNGAKEISSLETIQEADSMRLMRPLLTEKSCLACHAEHGYKLGQIRGGISATVPMAPLLAIQYKRMSNLSIMAFFLWIAGLIGNRFGMHSLNAQIKQRLAAEEKLRNSEKLKGVIEMAGSVCHELSQPMQSVYGYSEIVKMKMDPDDPLFSKIENIVQQIDRMRDITRKLMNITRYETKKYLSRDIIDIDKAAK
jgi:C4-dicarboxylate-specific signal transduction histidine kinase